MAAWSAQVDGGIANAGSYSGGEDFAADFAARKSTSTQRQVDALLASVDAGADPGYRTGRVQGSVSQTLGGDQLLIGEFKRLNPGVSNIDKVRGDRDYLIPTGVADADAARANFQDVAKGWQRDAQATQVAGDRLQSRMVDASTCNSAPVCQDIADQYGKHASILANAAQAAYANGNKLAGDAYQAEATSNYYASQRASLNALSLNAASQGAISATYSNPFGQGWNTGFYSAGLPESTPNFNGKYGVGLYAGVGGEIEVEISDNKYGGMKGGLGLGLGGHLNLGAKSLDMSGIMGPSVSGKWDISSTPIAGQAPSPGDYRIGPSLAGSLGIGTAAYELGLSGGFSSNLDSGTKSFYEVNHSLVISPVLSKISAEVKLNLIEFSYKVR